MIIKRIQLALMLAVGFTAAVSMQAQTMMEKGVISQGGGHTSSSGSAMDYTIGQPATGMAQSSTTMGQFGFWSSEVGAALSVSPEAGAGAVTALTVSPNPVSDRSLVDITLATGGQVDVTLYDVSGKAVSTLFSGNHPAGRFALPIEARGLAAGTYFLAVSVPGSLVQHPVTIVH